MSAVELNTTKGPLPSPPPPTYSSPIGFQTILCAPLLFYYSFER